MAIQQQDLAQAVKVYLRRAKNDKLPIFPLEERGTYHVLGGSYQSGQFDCKRYRVEAAYVKGRFIDAIAHAIQQPGFCGEWCSLDTPAQVDDSNHGHVVKVEPQSIPKNKSLDVLLK